MSEFKDGAMNEVLRLFLDAYNAISRTYVAVNPFTHSELTYVPL